MELPVKNQGAKNKAAKATRNVFSMKGSRLIVRFLMIPNEKPQIIEAMTSQSIESPFKATQITVIFQVYEA
jgi:hypothetical protein